MVAPNARVFRCRRSLGSPSNPLKIAQVGQTSGNRCNYGGMSSGYQT
jgi:hypothetical protein